MRARRWRHYETVSGRRPVREFLRALDDKDAASVATAMEEVQKYGLRSPGICRERSTRFERTEVGSSTDSCSPRKERMGRFC